MKRSFILVLWVALLLFMQFKDAPATDAATNVVTFSLGKPGFTDVIPRQIVRTNQDKLYVFAATQEGTSGISAYWTNAQGLPNNAAAFDGTTSFNETGGNQPMSLDAVYDGASTIHVLVNSRGNTNLLMDHPFDLNSNTFKTGHLISSGIPNVTTDYIGTSGVSGAVDLSGNLHIAFWANSNHIMHMLFTYNSSNNLLTAIDGPDQVDTNGSSNHPSVAVSRVDNSLTVAWVSEATNPAKILARTRSSAGTWGAVETVSTAPVWISTVMGLNIDQGPALVIDNAGVKHLTYIENYDSTGHYGHTHYVTKTTGAWTDTATPLYSHDPAVAVNSGGQVYIIGHGPDNNFQNHYMFIMKKNGSGWGPLELINSPTPGSSLDASVSVRWSAVGFNRPDIIEFLYFQANGFQYNDTTLYYGRLPSSGAAPIENIPSINYYTTANPVLTWSLVSWAAGYEVEVYTSTSLQYQVFDSGLLPPTQLFVPITQDLSEGTYYWRMRAITNTGAPGAWTALQSFTVDL